MRCTGGSAQKGSNELEPIIRIEQLTHTYSAGTPFQRSAVDGVELDIMPGEFLGVIGHTGSGKSTLIQHLNGLLKPTQGHIYLNGKDIWADPKQIRQVRFQVGLVFQYPEYQLFEETVYKDIAFGPGNMGLDKEEIDRRAAEKAWGLADARNAELAKDNANLKKQVAALRSRINDDAQADFEQANYCASLMQAAWDNSKASYSRLAGEDLESTFQTICGTLNSIMEEASLLCRQPSNHDGGDRDE